MKKIIVIISVLLCFNSFGQDRKPIEYSKFFDSYYRKGPLKFTLEPGVSIQTDVSYSIGMAANYKFNAPIEGVLGIRAVGLASGNLFQLNLSGRYYLRYDRIRTNFDRRKKPKKWKLYAVSGIGFAPSNLQLDIPLGVGIPLRLGDGVSVIPEFSYFFSFTGEKYMVGSIGIEVNIGGDGKKRKVVKNKGGGESESLDSESTNDSSENDSESEEPDTSKRRKKKEKEEPSEDDQDSEEPVEEEDNGN